MKTTKTLQYDLSFKLYQLSKKMYQMLMGPRSKGTFQQMLEKNSTPIEIFGKIADNLKTRDSKRFQTFAQGAFCDLKRCYLESIDLKDFQKDEIIEDLIHDIEIDLSK